MLLLFTHVEVSGKCDCSEPAVPRSCFALALPGGGESAGAVQCECSRALPSVPALQTGLCPSLPCRDSAHSQPGCPAPSPEEAELMRGTLEVPVKSAPGGRCTHGWYFNFSELCLSSLPAGGPTLFKMKRKVQIQKVLLTQGSL